MTCSAAWGIVQVCQDLSRSPCVHHAKWYRLSRDSMHMFTSSTGHLSMLETASWRRRLSNEMRLWGLSRCHMARSHESAKAADQSFICASRRRLQATLQPSISGELRLPHPPHLHPYRESCTESIRLRCESNSEEKCLGKNLCALRFGASNPAACV